MVRDCGAALISMRVLSRCHYFPPGRNPQLLKIFATSFADSCYVARSLRPKILEARGLLSRSRGSSRALHNSNYSGVEGV